jgi:hypothetical protein
MTDLINHPPHYTQGAIECIDALESALGPEGFASYCKGNTLKYLWRSNHKGGKQDLLKAAFYLQRLIDLERLP